MRRYQTLDEIKKEAIEWRQFGIRVSVLLFATNLVWVFAVLAAFIYKAK